LALNYYSYQGMCRSKIGLATGKRILSHLRLAELAPPPYVASRPKSNECWRGSRVGIAPDKQADALGVVE